MKEMMCLMQAPGAQQALIPLPSGMRKLGTEELGAAECEMNTYLKTLLEGFVQAKNNQYAWEMARDLARAHLASTASGRRAFGLNWTHVAVSDLIETMLTPSSPTTLTVWRCEYCKELIQGDVERSLV
ncbi:hypothetical protein K439DRAFT_1613288 [Ramaria rubella]|nr:hypothetical protein K439DRAFT_1613288 [Ramaria rubella]